MSAPAARPLDEATWPDKLTARVVAPGAEPAIQGYDVDGDLVRHYSFTETVFLAFTGRLPSTAEARAFEVALTFACPAPVNEAPTHAAVLARICMGTTSSIQGTAAVALAEQARLLVSAHAAWLDAPPGATAAVPEGCRARSDRERASVERLRRALRGTVDVPALAHDLSRPAAIMATLRACGLRSDQIECVLVFARLPVATAEALAAPAGSYRDYPLLLPAIEYQDPPA